MYISIVQDAQYQLLSELVRTADAQDAEAVRLLSEAITRFKKTRSAVEAYEKALQAYIEDTDLTYTPPRRVNPLEESATPKDEKPQPIQPASPPSPPKLTKQGIILEALAKQNGKGLKVKDIFRIIPNDAPIAIALEDLYRALPRLLHARKVWRDERGFYYAGGPPRDITISPNGLGESSRSLLDDTTGGTNE